MENNKYNIACFGEILWDVLPSGVKPGGAPMNVAFHLKKFGQNPAMITRVGLDERGVALKELLTRQNISTDFVQEDAVYKTGVVNATADAKGNMTYEILKPVAWDFIELEKQQEKMIQDADYFIFGSLAARSQTSHDTLFSLMEIAKKKVVDINLRAPHYNKKIVTDLFAKADILKLNDDELDLVTGWYSKYTDLNDRINQLQDYFKIPTIIVTLGAEGAVLRKEGETYKHNGYKVDVVDTVGSGDSFLAAFLFKTIEGATPAETLTFASAVGATVASHAGAWASFSLDDIQTLIDNVPPF
ncbi:MULTISPECIES: carbohydrate kinase family protein [Chitinophagaceae]